jgi:phage gp46-like protein
MTDIALLLSDTGFDIGIDGTDLRTDSGLRNAVILTLYTDCRAANDDVLPDGTDDLRGCWMDMFDDHIEGSRLWLLSREKETSDVLQRASEYAEEALLWLIDSGVATAIAVTAEWAGRGVLALGVVITLPNNTTFDDVFNYSLQAT